MTYRMTIADANSAVTDLTTTSHQGLIDLIKEHARHDDEVAITVVDWTEDGTEETGISRSYFNDDLPEILENFEETGSAIGLADTLNQMSIEQV